MTRKTFTVIITAPATVQAKSTAYSVLVNGKQVAFDTYNIGGNNYFKLRDMGEVFDFGVKWDGARNTISIDTTTGYSE